MTDAICPFINAPCRKHECTLYTRLLGTDPQTGNPVEEYDCSINMIPRLVIENSMLQNQTAASIQSFRNEIVEGIDAMKAIAKVREDRINGKT